MYNRDKAEVNDFMKMPQFIEDILSYYSFEKLEELFPAEVIKNTKRVIMMGNGDSYAASMALRHFFQKMWKLSDITAERVIDVGRHYFFSKEENAKETLVLSISQSGTGARIAESAERVYKKQCATIAITAGKESDIARNSDYLMLETGEKVWDYYYSIQNFTYTNAMINIYLVVLYGAVVRGVITRKEESELRKELIRYVESFLPVLDMIDEQMYQLALSWKDSVGCDFVGTGADIAAAYFGAAKGFEYSGSLNMYTDSEDWNHINFFIRQREKLGTFVVASKGSESISRTLETVEGMVKSHRRILLVSECEKDEVPKGIEYCRLPDTYVTEFKPLMNYIPFTLYQFHAARMFDYGFFDTTDEYGHGPLFEEPDMNKIKTSKRVFVD